LKFDFSIMQESTKTIAFVGGAALMVVAAAISHIVSQPRAASDFAKVGEPFFEKFDSSAQAQSLEVVAVDPETVQRNRFKVAKVDGLWRIPSHENYPAEASARLATTASSIIGIERESLAGRGTKDFKRLGVVDPLSDEIEDPEEVGQRITLKDENDETLADYIIGNEVEDVAVAATDRPFESGQNRQTYFYVRHAEESQTYIVPLELDLSTKFSDWIDPDLLRFDTSNLSQITVRNYSLEEQSNGNPLMPQRALVKKPGDVLALTKSDANAWELAGVETENEEFADAGVTDMIGVLEELQIEDVRSKLTLQGKPLFTPDLKVSNDPELRANPEQFGRAIQNLVGELEDKGFNLAGTQEQLALVSNHGEIEFGTNEGMRYTLYIGAPFEESDSEIKVSGAVAAEGDEADGESDSSDKPAADGEGAPEDSGEESAVEAAVEAATDDEDAKSRYMLVRVVFDQGLLADQPEEPSKPAEPKKPEGYTPPPAAEDAEGDDPEDVSDGEAADAKGDDATPDAAADKGSDEAEGDEKESDDETEETPARSPEFAGYDTAMEEHEQAMVDYELALTRYKDDQESFAKRVETAQQLEAELNERFGDWYYVISGENLKALQVSRGDLVTVKKPAVAPPGKTPAALPDRPNISFDGGPDEAVEPAAGSEATAPEGAKDTASEESAPVDATTEEVGAAADAETGVEPVPETGTELAVPETGTEPAVPETGTVPAVPETGTEPAVLETGTEPVPDVGTEAPVADPVPQPPTTPPAVVEPVPGDAVPVPAE